MEEEELECPNSSSEKRYFPESLDSSEGDEEGILACEDLELNPFDGLPYSSRYYKLLKEREDLPIWKEKYSFMENLLQSQIVIVSGDAKCGKSSQVPQWCAEYCLSIHYQHGGVVCTQVHKQTVVQLALRVADEMDVNIGHEVGYMIPFENCCTSETILRYCTDDMLQREMMSSPFLGSYGVIILDDIHERSIATDVLLGLLKDVLLARPELKLIINSSPHLISKLSSYYGNVPLIEVKNKHPVEVVYLSGAQKESFESILRLIFEIHHSGEKGDIVVFLACEQDIEKAYEIICQEGSNLNPDLGELVVVPLYPKEKCALFKPNDETEKRCQVYQRRVVLTATSGESLIWSNTVKFVIDVGVERRKVYNPRIRANSLVMQPISQSQAEIRKQILGSSSSGKLFCLYSEEFASEDMRPLKPAEMQEANLTSMVLFMKRIDIAGLGHCDFMNRPDSVEKWCHDNFLNCSALRMADVIRAELLEIIKRIELPYTEPAFGSKENTLNIRKALLSGYFMQIARDVDGSGNYLMLTHKQVAQLHPLSCYSVAKKMPEWVLFHKFSISDNNYIRIASEISPELFMQLAPQYYFSNLPPSESKDILQQVMDHLSPISTMKKEQKMCEKCPETTEQRCTVQ
ncbi:putative pre-mRNA-splicing factor ATP-dependent RNA helicase DHX32 isoform X2 [Mesoplodon densirostris]|uniref:putative pre-mRNA-splicing factor ATP-dependent RNA helicase DHX32 isoform X2 n=1 Tax=Mesoplodon densirostris TaxID=48708 RepID=UPI0028DCBB08|nr:putative pre-mRNA-splicing factor ATP-dependent RNA helicase DHX32 isoform X2 [Mesoplodon densirostris]